MTLERLDGLDLPAHHPHHGTQPHAFRCSECGGLSFPPDGKTCPYCNEEEE